MKKIENFCNCLAVLEKADFSLARENEIYRTGIIGEFNLTFELAWKALKAILEKDGVQGSETGSARDILKLAFRVGFLKEEQVWILMLKKRNLATHIYNEEEIEEMLLLIRESFLPAFESLKELFLRKQEEIEKDEQGL
jgi:nucleotidyltransferase substrate-binding family protein